MKEVEVSLKIIEAGLADIQTQYKDIKNVCWKGRFFSLNAKLL